MFNYCCAVGSIELNSLQILAFLYFSTHDGLTNSRIEMNCV